MNKKELIAAIAEKTDMPKASVEKVLNCMEETVVAEVKAGNEVKISL
jgi:DNA-binding protein HU-beta